MSQPFARAIAMMAVISAMLKDGKSINGLPAYKSRGKGKGSPSRRFGKSSGKSHPFSSARQDARHQRQGHSMVMVNGFEVMNQA